jgi:glutaconate CoA-transferase subunit A
MKTIKFATLSEAVSALVKDGDSVALEGFTHLIPFAAGHEIIRQGKRDLMLVRMTPDLVYDQLVGAGCARKQVFSWGGNPASHAENELAALRVLQERTARAHRGEA